MDRKTALAVALALQIYPAGASAEERAKPVASASENPGKAAPKGESPARSAAGKKGTPAEKATAAPVEKPGSLPALDTAASAAPVVDPSRGRGARSVAPASSERTQKSDIPPEKPAREKEAAPPVAAKKTGKRIAAGKEPARLEPDMNQRRLIAAGPTADDLAAGKDDAELRSLHEAELVLFPRPLPGFTPGWSWDLPKSVESSLPEIVTGAPPALRAAVVPKENASDSGWLRSLTMPNIPVRMEERVLRYLAFYRDAPSGRAIIRTWVRKSGRFAAALKGELARAGLPTDLVWLSLVESSHNPSIVSPAGAAGLWQFMPDAGRAYGLSIDRWVDERLDPVRSTEAACRYLGDLYSRFGGWELAMAAYNMGHGGLSRAIRKYNTNDFWELSRYEAGLPWETTIYVPKILATAIAMTNKRALGLDDVEVDAAERFDTVLVGSAVVLSDIARVAGVPLASIEALNPQYLSGRTPPSAPGVRARSWPVRVPAGTAASVREALAREAPSEDWLVSYVVRVGDTVESIAQARGATEAQIRALNGVDPKEVLAAGAVLLVPRSDRNREEEALESVAVVPPRTFVYPDRRRIFYRVSPGDVLSRIAEVFGVSRADLLLWNALDEGARLYPGMSLQVFVKTQRDLASVRYSTEANTKVLVAGSAQFFEHFEGQSGRRRFVVKAKSADTLATIGKRYGTSVGSMERINRRSRNDVLGAGEAIVVYTEKSRPLPGDELYVEARPRSPSPPGEPRSAPSSPNTATASSGAAD
jgi:membrane-bound lytic murein transglycosylase D